MSVIPYGKRAVVVKSANNAYKTGEYLFYVDTDSEVNVNNKETYYIFKSLERDLIQTLTEDEFEWVK